MCRNARAQTLALRMAAPSKKYTQELYKATRQIHVTAVKH